MTTDSISDTNNTATGDELALSEVFTHSTPRYSETLVERALEFRRKASQGVRAAFDAAIRNSVRVDGFRDASKATTHQLKVPVSIDIIMGNDKLASAALRAWAESHPDLHDLVVAHLDRSDVPAEYPDFKACRFQSAWAMNEWKGECDRFLADNEEIDEDDAAMMLCYVSGRVPAALGGKIQVAPFTHWLEQLDELPLDAPAWDEIQSLTHVLLDRAAENTRRLRVTQDRELQAALEEVLGGFEDDLRYLDIHTGAWREAVSGKRSLISDALDLATALRRELEAYSPIRPQGTTRSEEAQRATERATCEDAIFNIVDAWERIANTPVEPEDDPASEVVSDAPSVGVDADQVSLRELNAVKSELDELKTVKAAIMAELDKVKATVQSAMSENQALKQANWGLQSDMEPLRQQNGDLRSELAKVREMQEHWRQSYVALKSSQEVSTDEGTPRLPTVNDAIELANRTFANHIVVALNSKSAKNSPFQKPDEVYSALAWLATEYHRLRSQAAPGANPDFNKLIKESCPGWFYKPGQTEITTEQFAGWYTATVDGKSYDLQPHLGKGNSYDPQNTIRIAFAWDEELSRVVVGFLGLHQRNRRS